MAEDLICIKLDCVDRETGRAVVEGDLSEEEGASEQSAEEDIESADEVELPTIVGDSAHETRSDSDPETFSEADLDFEDEQVGLKDVEEGDVVEISTVCCGCEEASPAPRLMMCFHTACVRCLVEHSLPSGGISCPKCHHVTLGYPSVQAMPINFLALGMKGETISKDVKAADVEGGTAFESTMEGHIGSGGESGSAAIVDKNASSNCENQNVTCDKSDKSLLNQLCQECLEDNLACASCLCMDCDLFLCEKHAAHHRESRRTTRHILHPIKCCPDAAMPKESRLGVEGQLCGMDDMPKCSVHPTEALTRLCVPCSTVLCEICECLGHHCGDDHRIVALASTAFRATALEHLDFIRSLLQELQDPLEEADETAAELQRIMEKVNENAKHASEAITEAADRLIKLIEARKERLLRDIDVLRWYKLKKLESQHETIKSYVQNVEDGFCLARGVFQTASASSAELSLSACTHLLETTALLRLNLKRRIKDFDNINLMPCENGALHFVPQWPEVEELFHEVGLGYVFLPAVVINGLDGAVVRKTMSLTMRPPHRVSGTFDGIVIPVEPESSALTVSCVLDAAKEECRPEGLLQPRLVNNSKGDMELCMEYKLHEEEIYKIVVQHCGSDIDGSPFLVTPTMQTFLFSHGLDDGHMFVSEHGRTVTAKGKGRVYGDVSFSSGKHTWKMEIRSSSYVASHQAGWSAIQFGLEDFEDAQRDWYVNGKGEVYSSTGQCIQYGSEWAVPHHAYSYDRRSTHEYRFAQFAYNYASDNRLQPWSNTMKLVLELDCEDGTLTIRYGDGGRIISNVKSGAGDKLRPFVACDMDTEKLVNCFEVTLSPSY